MKSNWISNVRSPLGIGEVVSPREVTYNATCQQWFCGGDRASRVLPAIWVQRCKVASVSAHCANGIGGHVSDVVRTRALGFIVGRLWVHGGRPSTRVGRGFHEQQVDVAPRPILSGLEASDDRMVGLVEVEGGVLPGRVVATADMPARQAQSQMDPLAARFKALLAPGRGARLRILDPIEMFACGGH